MSDERRRIQFLVVRDGPEAARAWVERTLGIYRAALLDAGSHAGTPEFRPLFEDAVRIYADWLSAH